MSCSHKTYNLVIRSCVKYTSIQSVNSAPHTHSHTDGYMMLILFAIHPTSKLCAFIFFSVCLLFSLSLSLSLHLSLSLPFSLSFVLCFPHSVSSVQFNFNVIFSASFEWLYVLTCSKRFTIYIIIS